MSPCTQCGKPADFRYVWAWGEEGFSCEPCRTGLTSRAQQLLRAITFHPLDDDGGKKPYAPPTLRELPPDFADRVAGKVDRQMAQSLEVIALRDGQIATLTGKLALQEQHIAALEAEREARQAELLPMVSMKERDDRIASLQAELTTTRDAAMARVDELEGQKLELVKRITELEKRPKGQGHEKSVR
jgi:hypothetical protein